MINLAEDEVVVGCFIVVLMVIRRWCKRFAAVFEQQRSMVMVVESHCSRRRRVLVFVALRNEDMSL